MRGVAALVVVVHHNYLAGLLGWLVQGAIRRLPFLSPVEQGRPAVIFFFVLSGFVLTRALLAAGFCLTPASFVTFVAQRTIRLGIPVFGAVLLSAVLWQGSATSTCWPSETLWRNGEVWTHPPTAGAILRQSLLIGADGEFPLDNVLWSLVHEWRVSLVIPLLAGATALRGPRGAVAVAMAGLVLSSGFDHGAMPSLGPTLASTLGATVYFCLPFAFGSALALAGTLPPLPDTRLLAPLCLVIAVLFCTGSDLAVSAGSVLLIGVAQQPWLLRRGLRTLPLVLLGRMSYSLYLVHVPVLAALQAAGHQRLSPGALGALSIATALLVAWGFHQAVERPARILARQVGRPRPLAKAWLACPPGR